MDRQRSAPPPLQPSGMFVLRTALLAFDELTAWSDGLEAPHAPAAQRAEALARDREALRARLRVLIARPEVREALFVASPSLEAHLDDWRDAPGSARGRKVERALVRYVQRMAGRATPFGLFGGCTLGESGPATMTTELTLAPRAAYRRHTRLDMDYVVALTAALAADPALRASLAHRPNTSLYRAAGQLRYMETRRDQGGRAYGMVAVEPSEYLGAVLTHGRAGEPPAALAAALVARDPEIDVEDAAAFVDTLIERQILVPELEPAVTGPEPIHGLLAALDRVSGEAAAAGEAARILAGAQAELAALDAGGLGANPARYRAVAQALAALPAAPELARLFQVDMIKPAGAARLDAAVAAEIGRGVEILRSMSPPRQDELAAFRARFEARYERREVPLAQVLDQESGIGLGSGRVVEASPLLAGLDFGGADTPTPAWDERYALLQRKLVTSVPAGAHATVPEILLDDADLQALARPDALALPPGLAAMAVLATAPSSSPDEALARGAFRVYLRGARGPSGADLLARFCHADAGLDAAVRALVAAEEALAPDVIHAEIVHLPEGRVGNVLLRPLLRGYEIPYLGRSAAAPDRQIGLEDLLVSVTDQRVVLRSRRLDREILPRATTAHAARDWLPVYHFLNALARQGTASGLGWSWGPLARAPFLPRVVTGRLVLDLARWRLDAHELAMLARASGDALFDAVQALRAQRGLPRRVALVEADNLLPVDLDNVLSIEAFAQLVKERREAELMEVFPEPGALCVHGPEGRFVHELVVPLLRAGEARAAARPARAPAPGVARRFAPGSEWLYVKLYGGPATADRVLRGLVAPLVAECQASGAVDRWFFLRYGDPELHLRVRLHGPAGRLAGEVLPRLHEVAQPWLADQRLWRLALDTYEREVERYGGEDGVLLAEEIFAADSDAALALVSRLAGDAGLDLRWRITLWGMDRLLRDLGLDLAARHAVVTRARAGLGRRLGVDAALARGLGARYREERLALEDLVAPALPEDHPLAGAAEIFAERSARVTASAAALRHASAEGRLRAPLEALAGDFVHLHANRMLRGVSSRQELVIYDLLGRLYQSRQARGLPDSR
jgi:thiopeptide-type bacteriocin biosynthesis protein